MSVSQDLVMGKKSGTIKNEDTVVSDITCRPASAAAGFIKSLDAVSGCLNRGLAVIAGCSMVMMMILVVANGIIRAIHVPFYGTTEIVGWLCAVTIAFSLGYSQIYRRYVEIDIVVNRFPHLLQKGVRSLTLFASALFFALVSWQVSLYALNVAGNGNVSETLGIIFYPLIFLVALGFAGLTLALVVDFLKQVGGGAGQ